MIGKSLGQYSVTAEIGAGGMGQVYRATDSRLGRDVAIKVLPDEFARDPERLSRFEREAKLLASLSHSNIGAIHGLENIDGQRFLVLEFLEGEDLAKRTARGPVPVDETLEIARQIAEALEAAHESGIVHRDLKPANVIVASDGKVKVLDFGLAKALEGDTGTDANLSNSPTVLASSPTMAGVILGTAAYMSPEQARGKPVDRRADIFAFACVVFELLTGRQAFSGETVSDTLAAVLRAEPEWDRLPSDTPPALERLLRRCFDKNPRRRLRDIGEARIVIEDILSGAVDRKENAAGATDRRGWFKRYGPWIATAGMAIALIGALRDLQRNSGASETPAGAIHFGVPAPPDNVFRFTVSDDIMFGAPVVSADGRRIAFATTDASGRRQTYVRDFDQPEPRRLEAAADSHTPFWSPDGSKLAVVANGKLRAIPVAGGPATVLCDASEARGGTWHESGIILFVPNANSAIMSIPETGGALTPVTVMDTTVADVSHRWPAFLPDGRGFLFTLWTNSLEEQKAIGGIYYGSLDGGPSRRILPDASSAGYMTASNGEGFVLFRRADALMAAPFNPAEGRVTGPGVAVVEDIQHDALTGRTMFDASRNGTLVYRTGTPVATSQLEWFDRSGLSAGRLGERHNFMDIRLSQDAARVAASIASPDGSTDMWLFDTNRDLMTRFTFGASSEWSPVWSPDGRRVIFSSDVSGVEELFVKMVDGSSEATVFVGTNDNKGPWDWSRDGRYIIYDRWPAVVVAGTKNELWVHDVEEGTNRRLIADAHNHESGWFSPDGKWVLYLSDESGRNELYIRSFLGTRGGRWQISNEGADEASWRDDGTEIVYQSASQEMMSVPITTDEAGNLTPGTPVKLFDLPGVRDWDATGDHERFLLARIRHDETGTPIYVAVNWAEELARRQAAH